MLLVLLGPKGSGKSHIGRVIERHLGVHFFHVEPLWMAYYAECRAAGRDPSIPEGIGVIHPQIRQALLAHARVCVETTGASAEILSSLLSLTRPEETLVVRVTAPLELCLERVASRDQTCQTPMDVESIKKVHGLSASAEVCPALVLENTSLTEAEIVSSLEKALAQRSATTDFSTLTRDPMKRDLVVTRVFDAPVKKVWEAWSEPELVMRWWGPTGFTCPVAKMDFREGRTSLVCMRAPEALGGQDFFNTWSYEKVVPPERFAYVLRFADRNGKMMDPAKQGLPAEMPKEMRHEVTFSDLGNGKTQVTVTEYGWPVGQLMEMSRMGLEQCLDKMAAIFADPEG